MSDEPIIPDDPFSPENLPEVLDASWEEIAPEQRRALPYENDPFFIPPPLGALAMLYRNKAGLSQEAVDVVEQAALSKIESGHITKPWPATLRKLAERYAPLIEGFTADDIYEHLMEARDRRPPVRKSQAAIDNLSDRIRTFPPHLQPQVMKMLETLLDQLSTFFTISHKKR